MKPGGSAVLARDTATLARWVSVVKAAVALKISRKKYCTATVPCYSGNPLAQNWAAGI
jgi:hypothetical protein